MAGIDLHTHLAPAVADGARVVVDGRPVGPPALYRPDELVGHLDAAGLDTALVSLPPPFYRQELSAGECERWVRAANDGIRAATAGQARLRALAYLPFEHPAVALGEYERIAERPHEWAGVTAGVGGRSVSLADPALRPVWAALDADARTLLLHPARSPDPRLEDFYLENLLGNPVETALGAAQLLFGAVLAQFARVRVVLVHCGGAVPALVGRWQQGFETARPGLRTDVEPPAVGCRRFYVDCLAHDPAVLELAVRVFGADRLVLGSDWPFPMGCATPRELLAGFDPALVERIETGNARAALGWPSR